MDWAQKNKKTKQKKTKEMLQWNDNQG